MNFLHQFSGQIWPAGYNNVLADPMQFYQSRKQVSTGKIAQDKELAVLKKRLSKMRAMIVRARSGSISPGSADGAGYQQAI